MTYLFFRFNELIFIKKSGKRDCGCASLRYAAGLPPYGLNTHFVRVKLQILFTGFAQKRIWSHPLRGCRVPSRVIKRKKTPYRCLFRFRAGKGTRTLDPDLGKVVLYQLSYSRGVAQL